MKEARICIECGSTYKNAINTNKDYCRSCWHKLLNNVKVDDITLLMEVENELH